VERVANASWTRTLHFTVDILFDHTGRPTLQLKLFGRQSNRAKFCFLSILVRISSSAHGIKEGEQCLAHWSPRAVNGEHVLAHQFAPLLNPAFRSIGSVPLSFRPDFLVAWLCSIVVPPGFPGGMALFHFFPWL
jgi:hypothetical protein